MGFAKRCPQGFSRSNKHCGGRATADRGSVHSRAGPDAAWKTKPSWFLIAEEDRMINPKTQHFMADRMGATVRSHRVDHTPMYSEPNLVIR
jgi:pimeloyl-ACP methyl ester carboxylesterase